MIRQTLSAFGYEKRSEVPEEKRSDNTETEYGAFIPGNWDRAKRPFGFVSHRAVLSKSSVAARCVALRSELGAQVPLNLYRRLPNGDRERVSPGDHPLARVLSDLANPLTTAFEAREFFIRSLDLHGNAYGRIERNGEGQVTALYPLEPSRVQVQKLESGRLRYKYSGDRGAAVLLQEEVLHIRASSEDGLLGRSPLSIARESFQLGMDLNDAAATNAESGFKPFGLMTYPGKLLTTKLLEVEKSWRKMFGGPNKAGGLMVTDGDSKFTPMSWSAADAQLLQSRGMSASDTCFAFGLSPAILGLNESVSYGSAAQAAQDLVTNALQPLCSRIEQAMQRCLLTERGRQTYIIEHNLSGLLRSDPVARWQTWKVAREIGAVSAREIRRTENFGPMDPADDYTPLRGGAPQPAEPPIASTKP